MSKRSAEREEESRKILRCPIAIKCTKNALDMRRELERIKSAPVFVYGRRRDADGGEIDGEYMFYAVRITAYELGPYKNSFASVTGDAVKSWGDEERCRVALNRIFVLAPASESELTLTGRPWGGLGEFCDGFAASKLEGSSSMLEQFNECDRALIPRMVSVFGYMNMRVLASSAQPVVISPAVLAHEW